MAREILSSVAIDRRSNEKNIEYASKQKQWFESTNEMLRLSRQGQSMSSSCISMMFLRLNKTIVDYQIVTYEY
jgi:hypothetical protein